ncbi:MAG TPA: ABC transporter permease [Micromonosporaceae bacterium]|nr:ABC transporter permease [Micromonosporaceae bacterium]
MIAYTIRRLLAAVPILIVSSFIIFWVASLSADPIRQRFEGRNPPPPAATIQLERERLNFDAGFFRQYWDWLWNLVVHQDFGPSINSATNIGSELGRRTVITFRLVILAMILAVVLAVVTGVLSAVRQYSKLDYTFTFLGFLFLAMPSFWLAVVLKQGAIAFNDSVEGNLGRRPIPTINHQASVVPEEFWPRMMDIALHMVLPTISLALITYAALSRFQRSSMLEVLNSDYIRLARAKGLSARRVMVRHALRTALIPLTTVTALGIASILGGAVVTETVYQWRGMGDLLVTAVIAQDRYVTMGWLLVAGLFVILGNLTADLLYAVLDPRIRYE